MIKHFADTHSYLSSGRYSVALPRRSDCPPLGASRKQSLQRYTANERSILRKGTWKAFQAVVQEYLDLGHAEPVPDSQMTRSPANTFYLPMHDVAKSSSSSTKLRVVFDASAKISSNISLNDMLLTGPTLFPNLDQNLLRFLSYPVALSADIGKMYRAVKLKEEDRDLHRFLWRADVDAPITEYR